MFEKQHGPDSPADYLLQLGIHWHAIPPSAPHMGGIWEAAVKFAKGLIKRTFGSGTLSVRQLHTVTCETEAILNSRPLAPVSDEDTDLQPLTPAMLLTGFKHDLFPVLPVKRPTEPSVSRHPLQRYRYLQSLIADFWKRWKSEYLALLHQREKATKNIPNLAPGELVLIQDDLSAPAEWPMGRIMETYPGADGVVRSVKLRTQRGEMDRPVVKLRRLAVTIAVYRNDRMDEHDSD